LLWLLRPAGADTTTARTVQFAETQQCLLAHRPAWWLLLTRATGLADASVSDVAAVRAGAYFEAYLSTGHSPCEALQRVRTAARPPHVTAAALAAECADTLGAEGATRVPAEATLMICLRTSRRIGNTALLWPPEAPSLQVG
jgi:hypothetical protein